MNTCGGGRRLVTSARKRDARGSTVCSLSLVVSEETAVHGSREETSAWRQQRNCKTPIFESATTTVVAREGERVSLTPHGWLDIRLA